MKILLTQLRRLGDLILTTPAIDALRQHFPGAHLVLAISAECGPLMPAIAGVDTVIAIAGRTSDLHAWRQITAERFDAAIDLTRNDRSAWLTLLSRAPQRIVSDRLKRKAPWRALLYNRFVPCAMKDMHTTDYHLALLQPLGISGAAAEPRLVLPCDAQQRASRLIAAELSGAPFAVFHAGSARPEKFWAPDRWAEVMMLAKNNFGVQPVLSTGPVQPERNHAAEIRRRAPEVLDLSGRLDLLTLAALIERARFLVTVDSAPMHLAAALKTSQVAMFGPTNPFHWRPRGSPAAILFGDAPGPVQHFAPRTPRLPMRQISTGAVINAMRCLQAAPAASAV